MARDIAAFAGRAGQYIFISSASVYQKPARHYVITEETPAENPYWEYSQRKIACETHAQGAEPAAVDDRAAEPHGAHRPADHDERGRRRRPPHAPRQPGDRLRRRDHAVDADPLGRPRRALHPPVRQTRRRSARRSTSPPTAAISGTTSTPRSERLLGVEAKIVNVPTATLIRYHPPGRARSSATRPGRRSSTIPRSSASPARSPARRSSTRSSPNR